LLFLALPPAARGEGKECKKKKTKIKRKKQKNQLKVFFF